MPTVPEKDAVVSTNSQLREWGTSRAVCIPQNICDATGITIGDGLDVRSGVDADGAFVVIRPAPGGHRSYAGAPFISMEDAFRGYEGGYSPAELDWGDDVGAEVVE